MIWYSRLLRPKDLFVEKPLGFSSADAYRMADAIDKAGVKFQTGYFQRGVPVHLFLKDQIARGLFGKITRQLEAATVTAAHSADGSTRTSAGWPIPRSPAVARLAILAHTHSTSSSGCSAMFPPLPARWRQEPRAYKNTSTVPSTVCDETGDALLKFKSGVIGTLAGAWDDIANPVSLLISGTEAHAAVINGELFIVSKGLNSDGKQPWAGLPPAKPAGFIAFLDAITGKEATLVTPREAAYRSAVMEAIYEGAKHNNWETPKES